MISFELNIAKLFILLTINYIKILIFKFYRNLIKDESAISIAESLLKFTYL